MMEAPETTTVRVPSEAKEKLDELCRRTHRNKQGMLTYLIEQAHKALIENECDGDTADAA